MSDINEILKIRGSVYGDYKGGTELRATIIESILNRYYAIHAKRMPQNLVCCIWDIVNKLSRLAVTPDHLDSWKDISGYSKLIYEYLKKEKENANKQ